MYFLNIYEQHLRQEFQSVSLLFKYVPPLTILIYENHAKLESLRNLRIQGCENFDSVTASYGSYISSFNTRAIDIHRHKNKENEMQVYTNMYLYKT